MPGGSVYKYHAFNKETTPTSHETAHTSDESNKIHRTIFHNIIQVHEHPQYYHKYSTSTWDVS
jgi:hypothetical protein